MDALKEYEIKSVKVEDPSQHFFMKDDWVIDKKNGGLIYINQKGLAEQKKVFTHILSQIGSNLLSGKSVINISLPVNIFDKFSNLKRMSISFGYAPQILEAAVQEQSPIEQMKHVIAFSITLQYLYLKLQKPFNPILGETYQGSIRGCPIFAEQISHHPPICQIIFKGRGYTVLQIAESIANISANSVRGSNKGTVKVIFDNGNEFIFIPNGGTLTGNLYGDKLFNLDGRMYCLDIKNKLLAQIDSNPDPASIFKTRKFLDDYLEGKILRINNEIITRFKRETYAKFNGVEPKNFQTVGTISGTWHQHILSDSKIYWNYQWLPDEIEEPEHVLASDQRFREDIIAWQLDDFDLAMERKTKLEEIQRRDRKLRKDYQSRHK